MCCICYSLPAGAAPRMFVSAATLVIVPVTLIPHWQQQVGDALGSTAVDCCRTAGKWCTAQHAWSYDNAHCAFYAHPTLAAAGGSVVGQQDCSTAVVLANTAAQHAWSVPVTRMLHWQQQVGSTAVCSTASSLFHCTSWLENR
jgi:hypothetical protein